MTEESAGALRDRIRVMYKTYNPSKLDVVEEQLAKYAGVEAELLDALVKKYGPEPRHGSKSSSPRCAAADDGGGGGNSGGGDRYDARLRALFACYAPDRVSKVPRMLRKNEGLEEEVIQFWVEKLGPEPWPGAPGDEGPGSQQLQQQQRQVEVAREASQRCSEAASASSPPSVGGADATGGAPGGAEREALTTSGGVPSPPTEPSMLPLPPPHAPTPEITPPDELPLPKRSGELTVGGCELPLQAIDDREGSSFSARKFAAPEAIPRPAPAIVLEQPPLNASLAPNSEAQQSGVPQDAATGERKKPDELEKNRAAQREDGTAPPAGDAHLQLGLEPPRQQQPTTPSPPACNAAAVGDAAGDRAQDDGSVVRNVCTPFDVDHELLNQYCEQQQAEGRAKEYADAGVGGILTLDEGIQTERRRGLHRHHRHTCHKATTVMRQSPSRDRSSSSSRRRRRSSSSSGRRSRSASEKREHSCQRQRTHPLPPLRHPDSDDSSSGTTDKRNGGSRGAPDGDERGGAAAAEGEAEELLRRSRGPLQPGITRLRRHHKGPLQRGLLLLWELGRLHIKDRVMYTTDHDLRGSGSAAKSKLMFALEMLLPLLAALCVALAYWLHGSVETTPTFFVPSVGDITALQAEDLFGMQLRTSPMPPFRMERDLNLSSVLCEYPLSARAIDGLLPDHFAFQGDPFSSLPRDAGMVTVRGASGYFYCPRVPSTAADRITARDRFAASGTQCIGDQRGAGRDQSPVLITVSDISATHIGDYVPSHLCFRVRATQAVIRRYLELPEHRVQAIPAFDEMFLLRTIALQLHHTNQWPLTRSDGSSTMERGSVGASLFSGGTSIYFELAESVTRAETAVAVLGPLLEQLSQQSRLLPFAFRGVVAQGATAAFTDEAVRPVALHAARFAFHSTVASILESDVPWAIIHFHDHHPTNPTRRGTNVEVVIRANRSAVPSTGRVAESVTDYYLASGRHHDGKAATRDAHTPRHRNYFYSGFLTLQHVVLSAVSQIAIMSAPADTFNSVAGRSRAAVAAEVANSFARFTVAPMPIPSHRNPRFYLLAGKVCPVALVLSRCLLYWRVSECVRFERRSGIARMLRAGFKISDWQLLLSWMIPFGCLEFALAIVFALTLWGSLWHHSNFLIVFFATMLAFFALASQVFMWIGLMIRGVVTTYDFLGSGDAGIGQRRRAGERAAAAVGGEEEGSAVGTEELDLEAETDGVDPFVDDGDEQYGRDASASLSSAAIALAKRPVKALQEAATRARRAIGAVDPASFVVCVMTLLLSSAAFVFPKATPHQVVVALGVFIPQVSIGVLCRTFTEMEIANRGVTWTEVKWTARDALGGPAHDHNDASSNDPLRSAISVELALILLLVSILWQSGVAFLGFSTRFKAHSINATVSGTMMRDLLARVERRSAGPGATAMGKYGEGADRCGPGELLLFNDVTVLSDDAFVLRNASFRLRRGDVVGLVELDGNVGCDTIVDLLLGEREAATGSIAVAQMLEEQAPHTHPGVGYSPRFVQLWQWMTAAECWGFLFRLKQLSLGFEAFVPQKIRDIAAKAEIELPATMEEIEVERLSSMLGLAPARVSRSPLGHHSARAQRMAAMAVGFIGSPELVLLEDPLVSLPRPHKRAEGGGGGVARRLGGGGECLTALLHAATVSTNCTCICVGERLEEAAGHSSAMVIMEKRRVRCSGKTAVVMDSVKSRYSILVSLLLDRGSFHPPVDISPALRSQHQRHDRHHKNLLLQQKRGLFTDDTLKRGAAGARHSKPAPAQCIPEDVAEALHTIIPQGEVVSCSSSEVKIRLALPENPATTGSAVVISESVARQIALFIEALEKVSSSGDSRRLHLLRATVELTRDRSPAVDMAATGAAAAAAAAPAAAPAAAAGTWEAVGGATNSRFTGCHARRSEYSEPAVGTEAAGAEASLLARGEIVSREGTLKLWLRRAVLAHLGCNHILRAKKNLRLLLLLIVIPLICFAIAGAVYKGSQEIGVDRRVSLSMEGMFDEAARGGNFVLTTPPSGQEEAAANQYCCFRDDIDGSSNSGGTTWYSLVSEALVSPRANSTVLKTGIAAFFENFIDTSPRRGVHTVFLPEVSPHEQERGHLSSAFELSLLMLSRIPQAPARHRFVSYFVQDGFQDNFTLCMFNASGRHLAPTSLALAAEAMIRFARGGIVSNTSDVSLKVATHPLPIRSSQQRFSGNLASVVIALLVCVPFVLLTSPSFGFLMYLQKHRLHRRADGPRVTQYAALLVFDMVSVVIPLLVLFVMALVYQVDELASTANGDDFIHVARAIFLHQLCVSLANYCIAELRPQVPRFLTVSLVEHLHTLVSCVLMLACVALSWILQVAETSQPKAGRDSRFFFRLLPSFCLAETTLNMLRIHIDGLDGASEGSVLLREATDYALLYLLLVLVVLLVLLFALLVKPWRWFTLSKRAPMWPRAISALHATTAGTRVSRDCGRGDDRSYSNLQLESDQESESGSAAIIHTTPAGYGSGTLAGGPLLQVPQQHSMMEVSRPLSQPVVGSRRETVVHVGIPHPVVRVRQLCVAVDISRAHVAIVKAQEVVRSAAGTLGLNRSRPDDRNEGRDSSRAVEVARTSGIPPTEGGDKSSGTHGAMLLENINFDIHHGQIVCLVESGGTGAADVLLATIAGELKAFDVGIGASCRWVAGTCLINSRFDCRRDDEAYQRLIREQAVPVALVSNGEVPFPWLTVDQALLHHLLLRNTTKCLSRRQWLLARVKHICLLEEDEEMQRVKAHFRRSKRQDFLVRGNRRYTRREAEAFPTIGTTQLQKLPLVVLRKVAIACALVAFPTVLCLQNPLKGLAAPEDREEILSVVERLRGIANCTVVLSALTVKDIHSLVCTVALLGPSISGRDRHSTPRSHHTEEGTTIVLSGSVSDVYSRAESTSFALRARARHMDALSPLIRSLSALFPNTRVLRQHGTTVDCALPATQLHPKHNSLVTICFSRAVYHLLMRLAATDVDFFSLSSCIVDADCVLLCGGSDGNRTFDEAQHEQQLEVDRMTSLLLGLDSGASAERTPVREAIGMSARMESLTHVPTIAELESPSLLPQVAPALRGHESVRGVTEGSPGGSLFERWLNPLFDFGPVAAAQEASWPPEPSPGKSSSSGRRHHHHHHHHRRRVVKKRRAASTSPPTVNHPDDIDDPLL